MLVIEIFYTIFRFTGLNKDKARFQTVSLLTTAGFTTTESEDILNSGKRRKIAMFGMFFGYTFSVVIASSIINIAIGFMGNTRVSNMLNIFVILLAMLTIFLISRSERVTTFVNHLIKKEIEKYILKSQKVNPLYVLDTYGKFVICEVLITNVPDDLQGKTLIQAEIRQKYNVSMLTIKHNNEIKTIDATSDIISSGDRIIVFGDMDNIKELFQSDIL